MKKSDSISALGAALAKAQGEFTAAERDYTANVKTRKGSDYQFNYADLAAYLDVCREPLSKNGLAVIQEPVACGNKAKVTTLLVHSSGEWIEFEPLELEVAFKEPGEVATPQEIGSAITYARRYSQSAALNMASEQDDDGNSASGNHASTSKRGPKPSCPQCNSNDYVLEEREQPGHFFCWRNPQRGKHGCGHKWGPTTEVENEPPKPEAKANGKAKAVEKQHGMKTADQLPPKAEKPITLASLKEALKSIDPAADNATDRLNKADNYIYEVFKARKITADENRELLLIIADLQKEISGHKQLDKEAAQAAA